MERELSPASRAMLLEKEGSITGPLSTRADKRRYRKLCRQAEAQGLSFDVLLLRRDADRRWALFEGSVGVQTVYHSYPIHYVVQIEETFRERHRHLTYSYRLKRPVPEERSSRRVRLTVIGIDRISGTSPSYMREGPLEFGTELVVPPRELDAWRLTALQRPEAGITFATKVEEKIAYCQEIIDRGDPEDLYTQSWIQTKEGWITLLNKHGGSANDDRP